MEIVANNREDGARRGQHRLPVGLFLAQQVRQKEFGAAKRSGLLRKIKMKLPVEMKGMAGAEQLSNWFGYWPNFHDAEVIRLRLNRTSSASLVVQTWERTNEVDESGYYVLAKHAVVEFVMNDVVGLNVSGFNHPNVIFGVQIETTGESFRLTLDGCCGVYGTIEAKEISIRLTPGKT